MSGSCWPGNRMVRTFPRTWATCAKWWCGLPAKSGRLGIISATANLHKNVTKLALKRLIEKDKVNRVSRRTYRAV